MTAYRSALNIITPMTEQDRANRRAMDQRCTALIAQGICPSCHQFVTGDVFPGQAEQTYYQDALLSCHLETYSRGVGHTILVARHHYADIAEMPIDLGCHIVRITHAVVNALKRVIGANKVYMHTLCSGELSHLHFQFVPPSSGGTDRWTHICRRARRPHALSRDPAGTAPGGARLAALSDAVGGKTADTVPPAINPPPNMGLQPTAYSLVSLLGDVGASPSPVTRT